jgi:hypothetical protein
MTGFILIVLFGGWAIGALCLRACVFRRGRTPSQTASICVLTLALLALPICAVGVFYWWWRLGMLWTPDELPGIKAWLRLWAALAAVSFVAGGAAFFYLRQRGRSDDEIAA